jgi:esterase/lipase superfamily enzyme
MLGFAAAPQPTIARFGVGRVTIHTASTRPRPGGQQGDTEAHFELQTVTIPPSRRTGTIARPRWFGENPRAHYTLGRRQPMAADAFRARLTEEMQRRTGLSRDLLVFVHGFNTGSQEATFRLAQVVADTAFEGVPVLFTWPSRESVLAYGGDREIATSSRDALEKLLVDLGQLPDGGRVHVLAHSMGAWLAMEALRQASISGHRDLGGRLGEVMLAAPDIDLDVFRAQLARIGTPSRFTVFAASDDRALQVSSILAGERPRLGAIDLTRPQKRALISRLGVRVVDLTSVEGIQDTTFRHGSFAEAPDVVRLIGAKLNAPPPEPLIFPTVAIESTALPAPEMQGGSP